MSYHYYIVFDIGASNGRAVIAKFNGSKFDIEIIHKFKNRPVYATGTLYWDILSLYSEIKIGIQSSVKKYKNITSLGVDTWGGDFGFISKDGKLISNPVHYRDKERNSVTDKFYEIIPKTELYSLTGGLLLSAVSVFHLFSLKIRNAPELINAHKFLMMPDIFNYFLTGKIYNEFTNATTTTMYNLKEKKWDNKILNKLGISKDIFAKMIMPGRKIGNISKDVCTELEIKSIPVIAPATHDTASAVVGIPVTGINKNWAFISIGTWCVIGKETKDPLINEDSMEAGYANEGGVGGCNLFYKNIIGLWIIEKCREKWFKSKDNDISWDEIIKLSSTSKPFKSFINVDDPIFFQPQLDMPQTIREYCKKKGQNIPESIGDISRCIYESLALRVRFNLNFLEKLTREKIELLYIVGGGTKNSMLCQWTSNATGIPVIAGPTEATAIGNLLMQLKNTREIKNLEEGRKITYESSDICHYEPKNKEEWDEKYNNYLNIVLME